SDVGVAVVNLSGPVRLASANQLRQLSAQLVWTLAQVPRLTSVQVLVDGSALTIPGVPATQDRGTWSEFDPAPPSARPAVYTAGGDWRVVGGGSTPALRTGSGLAGLARSADGSTLAGLRLTPRHAAVLTWRNGGLP